VNKSKFSPHSLFGKGIFAKKSARLLFEVIGSVVGLVFVILFLLLVRLSMSPINLDFLTTEVEAAFKAPQEGLSAKIEHTQLVWREWKRPFEIELVNVHLQKNENPNWLKIEHIGISVRLYRLLLGEASLKQLRLYRPHILLEKDEKGEFSLGFGESKPNQEFSFQEIAPLVALGEPNTALGKLNDLNKVAIIDAHVLLKDEKEGKTWELPKTSFVLKRQSDGFQTELTLRPHQGHGTMTVGLNHQLSSGRFDLTVDFHHVSLKKLFEKKGLNLCLPSAEIKSPDDLLDFLQCWDTPLQGKIHLALAPDTHQVIEGSCDVDLGKGTLDLSLAKLVPLPISSGNLSFTLLPNKLEIKKASLLSDEMLLDFSGHLESSSSPLFLSKLMEPGQTLTLQGRIEDLFLDHLSALWPEDLATHAREWLTKNLRKGLLTEAEFSLKGHGGEEGFLIDDLKGTLRGEGAEVTFLEGLPPAENVSAHATFDQKGFDIKVLTGNIEQIKVQEGHVLISDLDTDNEKLSLNMKAKGPVSDILGTLNHKPLEYASLAGIDPKKTNGEGEIVFKIDFPLLVDLQFKDIKMNAKGGFKKVNLERKISEDLIVKLTQGNFSLDLTQDQMVIQGKGVMNQLPSTLTYEHFFKKEAPHELQVKIETMASFEDFKRLGFDYLEYARGPTPTTLLYTLEKDKRSYLRLDLDTTMATLTFAPLEWKKRPGEKGKLFFVLVFEDGNLSKMTDLRVKAPPYFLRGEILFGPQKNWKTIHLSQFEGPDTQTQVTLHTPHPNVYEVSFHGQSVDLEKFMQYVDQEGSAKDHPPMDIKLFGDVEQLRLGEGKVFENISASAHLFLHENEKIWKEVHLRAKAGKGTASKGDMAQVSGGILFDINPGPNNTQSLEVRANDAGKFLKNLGIYDHIRRGALIIKAQKEGSGPFKGILKLKDFDAQEVPLLARFAALLSPMGVVNLFSGKKILSMDRFTCDFEFGEDFVAVKQGVGKSLSLGFTVEGKLDRNKRLFALRGNVIPARFLNSIFNNIPILGPLISGGKGEGLFGIAYTVKGSFDNPNVSLNPLSALAPGFFRKLFQSLTGDDE